MCWISKNKPEQLIAEEDIIVYKIVNVYFDNKILSYFNDFPYNLGEVYNDNSITLRHFKDYYNDFYFINQGFHSYNYKLEIGTEPFLRKNVIYDKSNSRYYGDNVFGMFCIIPKGAECYINEVGDIVSTSIKPIALSTKELNNLKKGEHFEYDINYLFGGSCISYRG